MQHNKALRLVIAEDEYLIAQDIARAAREFGYEVVGIAPDGEKAFAMVVELKPDAVVLDIMMPKLSGLEVAKKLNDEHPVPVVIMTAYESRQFLEEAKSAGVGAYLVKPPQKESLMRALEIATARHADMVELKRLNAELQTALATIKTLEGILPICSSCKKVRDDKGYWEQVEAYFTKHTDLLFSHGICPECIRRLYPDMADEIIDP